VTSWSIVGSDYVWPHTAAAETARHLETTGCYLDRVEFFPIGTSDYASGLDRLAQSPATGVVVLLIGQDAVEFHRQFHAQGLDEKMIRVTPLMDENMILAAGPDACRHLYVSAGYFYSLPTATSMEFVARYTDAFGVDAPMVGTMAESCYEAIHLLAALAARAKSLRVDDMIELGDNLVFENVRGTHRLRHSHTQNPIYLADVEGMDFRILTELSSGPPG